MNTVRRHIDTATAELQAALEELQGESLNHIGRVECVVASCILLLDQARKHSYDPNAATFWAVPDTQR